MNKIKDILVNALDKLPSLKLSNGAMRYIKWYAVLVAVGCILYIAAWLVSWHIDKRPSVEEMRQFITTITNPAWVAAIAFISKMLVDQDCDDIPDEIEKKEEE